MPCKRLSGATDNIKVINAPQPDATITPVSNNTRRAAIAAAATTEIAISKTEQEQGNRKRTAERSQINHPECAIE
jgi:hypothetical protein